jgi:hypothetical protein
MEISQGNSLYSYIKGTKMSFFFFFLFTNVGEQEGGTGPAWVGWYQWEGEEMEKRCGRVNIVQILCACMCKWNTDTC